MTTSESFAETRAFRDRTAQLRDDLWTALQPARFATMADDAIEGAILASCERAADEIGTWPQLADEQVWHVIRTVAVERLGFDYDEIYEVTLEPFDWRKRGREIVAAGAAAIRAHQRARAA
jgi:hypothetical protein